MIEKALQTLSRVLLISILTIHLFYFKHPIIRIFAYCWFPFATTFYIHPKEIHISINKKEYPSSLYQHEPHLTPLKFEVRSSGRTDHL